MGSPAEGRLAEGVGALNAGRWDEAVAAFERAVEAHDVPETVTASALDGLADAKWRRGDANGAIEARERAYAIRRRTDDRAAAARAAAWLAREYATAVGNLAAAQGWLARAETLSGSGVDRATEGWVMLARATLADGAREQRNRAETALDLARAARDSDLEILALARLGLALVTEGHPDLGMSRLDEAMAAATAGESRSVTTLPHLCCDFVLASELAGESERFARWSEVVDRVAATHGQPSAAVFCTTCCAETSVAHGDLVSAEKHLHVAVVELTTTGRKSRCIPPQAKLAEVLLLQGRVEEAGLAIANADDDTSLVVRAKVALAGGDSVTAITFAERARRRLGGDGPLALAPLAVLVDAHLAAGEHDAARDAAGRLATVAAGERSRKAAACAAAARGRVARAAGDAEEATTAFEEALDWLGGGASIDAASVHLELAGMYAGTKPQLARVEARAALAGFEATGASQLADAAAATLRSLGDRSRVGAKDVGVLSQREQEVLRLVAAGLTNAEIAERLFISTKTAGNHVSAILMKLGFRSRTEAATYAALNPPA